MGNRIRCMPNRIRMACMGSLARMWRCTTSNQVVGAHTLVANMGRVAFQVKAVEQVSMELSAVGVASTERSKAASATEGRATALVNCVVLHQVTTMPMGRILLKKHTCRVAIRATEEAAITSKAALMERGRKAATEGSTVAAPFSMMLIDGG